LREREGQDLKDLFQDLQEEDRQRVPSFRNLMARVRDEASRSGAEVYPGRSVAKRIPRRLPRRLAWSGSLLAAAAAAVLLLVQTHGTSDAEFVQIVQAYSSNPSAGAWRSPTDGLLELPGRDILSTVPSISTRGWFTDPVGPPRRNEL
jgi:hypothetical protein